MREITDYKIIIKKFIISLMIAANIISPIIFILLYFLELLKKLYFEFMDLVVSLI